MKIIPVNFTTEHKSMLSHLHVMINKNYLANCKLSSLFRSKVTFTRKIESKFYDFDVDLDKTSEEERNGGTLQSLEGTFGLGPHISYAITNATMKVDDKNPVLTIQGERD